MLKMAQLFLSKGAIQFTKKYGAKALKDVKQFITKNKLIWDGKKIIEKTTKAKTPPKVNPKIKNANKKTKDSFDEELKKKEGTKVFNKTNKDATANTTKSTTYDDTKLASTPGTLPKNIAQKIYDTKTGKAVIAGAGAAAVAPYLTKGVDMMKNMFKGSGEKSTEASSFGEAFKKARKEKGTDSTFTWKGNTYSTVTMDEVKKAGFNTLREYLNAKKKG